MPQDRASTQRHLRQAYTQAHCQRQQVGQKATADATTAAVVAFDLSRMGKRFSPIIRKSLDDDRSDSSTRGSSPCTESSVFSAYAESSQSSRGTSIPPDELGQNSIGCVSDCGGEPDYRSPNSPAGAPSPGGYLAAERKGLLPRSSPRPEGQQNQQEDCSVSEGDLTSESSDPDDSDSDDGNDWSQDDGLESTVIAAAGGNLDLASYLIPIIHKSRNAEYVKMIHAWQGATQAQAQQPQQQQSQSCTSPSRHNRHHPHHQQQGTGSPTYTSSTGDSGGTAGRGPGGTPHKKRKRSNSSDFGRREDDGDEDEEEGGRGGGRGGSTPDASPGVLLLACPFHKLDPNKYSAKSGNTGSKKRGTFRACAGPGWKSIQRLKEHLRRNHSPVQCSRCFTTFQDSDRATSMSKLEEHHRQRVQCEVGNSSLREGISDVQWAELDKKKARRQDGERVGKWFEIWDILFPDAIRRPGTPFYEWAAGPQATPPSNPGREQLVTSFSHVLDHMVQSYNIDFSAPYDEIKRKLMNATGIAFDLYRSTSNTSSEDSSSLTKTTAGSKESHQTQETAATSITLPVSTVSGTQAHGQAQQQQQQQPGGGRPQAQQQFQNQAIPRTMPGAPQYAAVPMGRAPTMMPQMGGPQVPRSPPMAQQINFPPYYPLQTMPATGWHAMPQGGFDGTTQFSPMDGTVPAMYYAKQEEWM